MRSSQWKKSGRVRLSAVASSITAEAVSAHFMTASAPPPQHDRDPESDRVDGQLDGALRQHAVAIKRRAGPQEDRKLVQLPRLVPGRPLRLYVKSRIFIDISTASTTSTHGATGEPNAWDARPLYGTDCVAQRGPPRIHGRRAAHPVAATSSRDRGKQEDMHGRADERSECRRAWHQLPERHEVAARTG